MLLSKTDDAARLRYAATKADWLEAAFNAALTNRCPLALATGVTLDVAMLAQFELACCDSAAVFIRDEVVAEHDHSFLSQLYRELSSSEEFQPVGIQVHSVPHNDQGRRYLQRFLGSDERSPHCAPTPLHLMVMKKKARIMCYWGRKIGAAVTMAES